MATDVRYSCAQHDCPRTDLSLTANGRVRSHTSNGKRASKENPYNPHCPGGSNWPVESTEFHTHRFEYGDDDMGHSGSFCTAGDGCEMEEPDQPELASGRPNPHRAPLPTSQPGSARYDQELASAGSVYRPVSDDDPGEAMYRAAHGLEEEHGDVATSGDASWQETSQPSSAEQAAPTTPRRPTSDLSSTPSTRATARSAGTGSTPTTSSGRLAAGTTSTPSAPKSGSPASSAATSFVTGAAGGEDNSVPRDRYGRYLLPRPDNGRVQPWTRATTMAGSIADTFALSQWSQRMAVKGLTLRDDLYALASTLEVGADKDDLNSVCEQAKAAAGDKVAANLGTAMHAFTAAVDRGEDPRIPPKHRADVAAYLAILAAVGLRPVPHLIERRIALTRQSGAGEDIAGTFDRVYQAERDISLTMADGRDIVLEEGDCVVGDLKTGRDLAYGWGEIAIQEAIYAHGINENGVWDTVKEDWDRLPLGYYDGPDGPLPYTVREDVGIVVHLPIQKTPDKPPCELFAVDLAQGWEAIALCAKVRLWRKAKKIASLVKVADQLPPVSAEQAARAHFPPATLAIDTRPDVYTQEQNARIDAAARGLAANAADTRDRTAAHPSRAQAPAGGFDRPTASQMSNHPSVASPEAPPAVRTPTWEERARTVSTKAEASQIFQEMRARYAEVGATRVANVTKIMQDRLASL